MTARTGSSHPLRVDAVAVAGGGRIGMTFCPGKKDRHAMTGRWDRDLDADLASIQEWGASLLVTLVEDHELSMLKVPDLGTRARDHGLDWLHLPIVDVSVPSAAFEAAWPQHARGLAARLAAGDSLVLHCRGGLGRTGLVAARLLIELGNDAVAAIARVRAARHGAIETAAQEADVLRYVTVTNR
jgi:ADP-ribosyl-[dinitrogen reductase] hydrolase